MTIAQKALVLGALPLTGLIAGLVGSANHSAGVDPEAIAEVQGASTVLLIFAWFWLDARERQFHASWALRISMIALTVAALPYYLFRSRGMSSGFKAWGLAVLLLTLTMLAYRLTARAMLSGA